MTDWVNRNNGTAAKNATTSHTFGNAGDCTPSSGASWDFSPTAGRLLVFICGASVTNTSSGSGAAAGWTKQEGPVNSAELSLFTKVAVGGDYIVLDHNGSDYAAGWAIYEFPAGYAYIDSVSETASDDTWPALSGLPSSSKTVIGAFGACVNNIGAQNNSTCSSPWTEYADLWYAAGAVGGFFLYVLDQQATTGTSFTPACTVAATTLTADRQKITVAVGTIPPTVTAMAPSPYVIAGQSVTITGTGFSVSTPTVDFGGSAATNISVTNDTTLTCTVPAHALGDATVTATTSNGTSGGFTATYRSIAVVSVASAAITASPQPSVTFPTTWTPLENDVVVLFPSSTTTATVNTVSGWVNPLGAGVDVESDAHEISVAYHLVTAGEQTAVTRTYTITASGPVNWYGANETGNVVACVVRGVNASAVVDDIGSANNVNAVATAVLAGLTGANLLDDSLVLSAVAKDGTGTGYTQPADWTSLITSSSSQDKMLLMRNALTTASVNVDATNITQGGSDEYASITLALTLGVQNFVKSYNDPEGITDAATRVATADRSFTDAVGIADAATKIAGRSLTNAVGLTDSVTVIVGRNPADAVGITDAATRVADALRVPTDPVGVTDTATKSAGRFPADAVGVTDAATVETDRVRDATDLVGVTDSAATVSGCAFTNPVGVADSAAITADWVRTVTDPLGITDDAGADLTAGQEFTETDTEPVGISDDSVIGAGRAATDPEGIADSASTVTGRTLTDPVGVSDSASAVMDGVRTATDAVGVVDAAELGLSRTIIDSSDVTDSITLTADWVRAAIDPVGVTDTATVLLQSAGEANAIDDIGVTDSAAVQADYARSPVDPVGVTDTTGQGSVKSYTEQIGITDTAAVVNDAVRSVTDPLGVSDAATVQQDWVRSPTDTVGITDAAVPGSGRAAINPVAITDAAGFGSGRVRTDSLGISDTAELGAGRAATDPLGVTDSTAITQDWVRTVTDPLGITDSHTAVLQSPGEANATDEIGLTDNTAVTADTVRSQTDPVGVTDTAAVAADRTVTDQAGITDAVIKAAELVFTDQLDISDSPTVVHVEGIHIDVLGVADTAVHDYGSKRSDPIGLDDTTGFVAEYIRAFTNPVGVADSATFQLVVAGEYDRDYTNPIGIADSKTVHADAIRPVSDLLSINDAVRAGAGKTTSEYVGLSDAAVFQMEYVRAFTNPVGLTDSHLASTGAELVTYTEPVGIADAVATLLRHTIIVPAETRAATVPAERRTMVVPDEPRYVIVPPL